MPATASEVSEIDAEDTDGKEGDSSNGNEEGSKFSPGGSEGPFEEKEKIDWRHRRASNKHKCESHGFRLILSALAHIVNDLFVRRIVENL